MIALPKPLFEEDLDDPTPAEITRRAAAIRRGWSKAQRTWRRVHKPSNDWQPPIVFIADLAANMPVQSN